MNHRMKAISLAAVLALAGINSLEASESTVVKVSEASIGSVVSLPVLSLLAAGSLLFGFEGEKGLLTSVVEEPKPRHTQVTAVLEREDGSREVELAARDTNGGTATPTHATVVFPRREDGGAEAVVVGDALDFTPSPGGSGWIVHRNEGAAIAFLPTPQAQSDLSSERL